MLMTYVLAMLIGGLLIWRTVENTNHMGPGTAHHIRVLNTLLAGAGFAMLVSPLGGIHIAHWAAFAALACFLGCMFIGRRPTDRVLGR